MSKSKRKRHQQQKANGKTCVVLENFGPFLLSVHCNWVGAIVEPAVPAEQIGFIFSSTQYSIKASSSSSSSFPV